MTAATIATPSARLGPPPRTCWPPDRPSTATVQGQRSHRPSGRGDKNVVIVAGARVHLGRRQDLLAPHHVLVVDPLGLGIERHLAPADAIEVIARVDAYHRLGQSRDAFRRIGPRPGRREHADRAHGTDLVVKYLVGMAVDVGDLGVWLDDLVHFAPVAYPEVPRWVVLVQRIMGENDDGPVRAPVGQSLVEVVELLAAEPRPCAPKAPSRVAMAAMRSVGLILRAVQ